LASGVLVEFGEQRNDDTKLFVYAYSAALLIPSQRLISKKNMVFGTLWRSLTISFPYVHSRVDSNTFTMGNHILYPPAATEAGGGFYQHSVLNRVA
jgi:hypothetical protein